MALSRNASEILTTNVCGVADDGSGIAVPDNDVSATEEEPEGAAEVPTGSAGNALSGLAVI